MAFLQSPLVQVTCIRILPSSWVSLVPRIWLLELFAAQQHQCWYELTRAHPQIGGHFLYWPLTCQSLQLRSSRTRSLVIQVCHISFYLCVCSGRHVLDFNNHYPYTSWLKTRSAQHAHEHKSPVVLRRRNDSNHALTFFVESQSLARLLTWSYASLACEH